jgi:hypothetical protein
VQCAAQLRDDVDLVLERQGKGRGHPRIERGATQELHHDVRSIVVFGELKNRDDVRVLQPGGRLRFAVEPRTHLGQIGGKIDEHHLDRDFAVEDRIEAPVENGGVPLPDALEDVIPPDLLWVRGRHQHVPQSSLSSPPRRLADSLGPGVFDQPRERRRSGAAGHPPAS